MAALESSDPRATYRLMRACAGLGLLASDGDGRFSVTPAGALLGSGVPGSLRDHALAFGAPGHWLPWGRLPEAVRAGETQAAAVLGAGLFDYLAGQLVRELMRVNDGLHGQVLDLPEAAKAAVEAADADGLGTRFSAEAGDFFAAVPAADLYLLKAVLHDWDDDSCVRILRNCRAAARPGARVIVIENVIRDAGRDRFATLLDMNMLAVTTAQERDLAAYDALFAAAGWRREAVRGLPGARSLLELRAA